jgi:hypothetical protein
MGFWQTGYGEFHEESGLIPPFVLSPLVYECRSCRQLFASVEQYQQHRFDAHPLIRPMLLIEGREIGDTEHLITTRIHPSNVRALGAQRARLNDVELSPAKLGDTIQRITSGVVLISLQSEDLVSHFRLRIEIAHPDDLLGIERAFRGMVRRGRLDLTVIEDLIKVSSPFVTAKPYLDGICDYLYGVLAKEDTGGSNIGYASHQNRFTQASHKLFTYHTSIGSVIRALVAFNFNQFNEASHLAPDTRIGVVARRYVAWLGTDGSLSVPGRVGFANKIDRALTDRDTEDVLRFAMEPIRVLKNKLPAIERALVQSISEMDRAKLRVMAAEALLASGNLEAARTHAREIRNVGIFKSWADRVLVASAGPRRSNER